MEALELLVIIYGPYRSALIVSLFLFKVVFYCYLGVRSEENGPSRAITETVIHRKYSVYLHRSPSTLLGYLGNIMSNSAERQNKQCFNSELSTVTTIISHRANPPLCSISESLL